VKIEASYEYDAPVAAVEAALLDPAFWKQLRLANMAPPQVVAASDGQIVVHMVFAGTLNAIGRRVVGNQPIEWDQTITIDRAQHTGTLTLASRVRVNVTAEAALRFEALAGDGTRQTLSGEMKVHIPLVGGKVESALGPGVRKSFDEEAASLRTWLTSRA
jgi:hypothetical protein